MKRYLLILLALAALWTGCSDDDDPAQQQTQPEVTDESYLTEVVMQHFAILNARGEISCRTEYQLIDRNSIDSTIVYAYAPTLVEAHSIFCSLVATNTKDRIVANADSSVMTYTIAGNPRPLTFLHSNEQGIIAVIQLPYTDAYQHIATQLTLLYGNSSNSGETDGKVVEIPDHGSPDTQDARH